ncbi:MAG: metal-dependent hydrolase [Anaerolineae bacterium]|nr:metal-dependent hydrolase [Anaerolineae bacterium]
MENKITWYGHATFGLTLEQYSILIDPFFTQNPAAPVKADAVKADYILVSHGHFDHIGDAVEISKRENAPIIANAEVAGWLGKQHVKTHAQQIGGGFQHPFGYVKLTIALHGSRLPDGSYGGLAAGFIITTNAGKKIYFAGDTGLFGDMALIGEEGIFAAILPIGDNYTMGPVDALRALKMIRPQHVIPMHFGTWELINQDAAAWCQQAEKETGTTAHLLTPGESFSF